MDRSAQNQPTLSIIFLLIGLAASTIISSNVQAEDGKVYPSTFCQGSLVGNPPITSYQSNKLVNNSTTNSAVVICPVIKDSVFATTGANEAYFRYYKGTTTGFIANLYSYSAYGTSSYTQFRSDYGAAGNKIFSYSPISSYSQGYYSFVVVIPPGPSGAKSAVLSYRLDENE